MKTAKALFAERLEELFKEKGYKSISDFSQAIKIPRSSITAWINQTRSPQIDALIILSRFFKCSIDYLLGEED